MQHKATKLDESATWQEIGTVTMLEGVTCVVRAGAGVHRARRAVGCLVAPAVGDLVFVAVSPRGCWVLSVLERASDAPTRLSVEGDLEIVTPNGVLRMGARDGVEMSSESTLTVVVAGVHLRAAEGEASFDRASLAAGVVDLDAGSLVVRSSTEEHTVERLTQRIGSAQRFVAEVDRLRAGHIDYRAERMLEMHGEHAMVTAEGLVKVDAAQIHIG